MKSLFILIFLTAISNNFCAAQVMQILPQNSGDYTKDLLLLSQSEATSLDNADVSGNPFWDENWKTAFLFTDDYKILIPRVKLNLYKNDVWYTTPEGLVMITKK